MKMMSYEKTKQSGIGLIEVLITTVVVALGLLALASFQNNLIRNSGKAKIRSEALALAEQTIEDVRNNISANQFISEIPAVTNTDTFIAGTNANFTRVWDVVETNAFTGLDRKKISVQVGWDANADGIVGATDEERVILVTEISWNSPQKSALYATENNLDHSEPFLTPRQNASEDAVLEDSIGTDLSITDLNNSTTEITGVDLTLAVDAPDPGQQGSFISIILNQIAPGSHFYIATNDPSNLVLNQIQPGVIAVFLCNDADNDLSTADTCTHIKNFFGGVVLRVMGTVYSTSTNGLDHIQVAWASSTVNVCYHFTSSISNNLDTMQYECVFAGNCNATENEVNGCLADSIVSDSQINTNNVKPGGEFGEVGLLGLKDSIEGGFVREELCFLEDTALDTIVSTTELRKQLNFSFLRPVSKRSYQAKRMTTNGDINHILSEGINRSYANHNFLIIERKNNLPNDTCEGIANVHSIVLAPRKISRLLNENSNNDVLDEIIYSSVTGTPIITTGSITDSEIDIQLFIDQQGSCYLHTDNNRYACVFSANTSDLTIKAASTTFPDINTPQFFASCTNTPSTRCDWTSDFQ